MPLSEAAYHLRDKVAAENTQERQRHGFDCDKQRGEEGEENNEHRHVKRPAPGSQDKTGQAERRDHGEGEDPGPQQHGIACKEAHIQVQRRLGCSPEEPQPGQVGPNVFQRRCGKIVQDPRLPVPGGPGRCCGRAVFYDRKPRGVPLALYAIRLDDSGICSIRSCDTDLIPPLLRGRTGRG